MESSIIIFAMINLLVGAVLLFFGLKLMKFAVSLIGFLIGYSISAPLVSSLGADATLSTVIAIIIGIAVGALAFGFYKFAITLSIAFFFGNLMYALLLALNLGETASLIIAVITGVATYALIYQLKVLDVLFAIVTSVQGASLIVVAVYALLNPANASVFDTPAMSFILSVSGWWFVAWLSLAIMGGIVQLGRHTGEASPAEQS